MRGVAAACRERLTVLRADLDRLSQRQIGWLVFLATLCVYVFLTPHVLRNWWLTGDEPHYLVVTHSLLTDRDLDLSNNYQEKDFTLFYTGDRIDPHVIIGPDGGAYPSHTAGLSVVLLPAYALGYLILGSHAGVLYFLASMGALLAANVYLLCYEVTARKFSSLLAWLTTAFTVPVMHYSFQVYPEIMAALLLVWSLRHIRRGWQTKPRIWLVVGLCIGLLPWLGTRLLVVSSVLGLLSLYHAVRHAPSARHRRSALVALCCPVIVLITALMAFNAHLYGSVEPSVGYAPTGATLADVVRPPDLAKLATGLLAWLFDEDHGLFVYAPIYLVSLPGLILLLRDNRRDAVALSLPAVAVYLSVAWVGFWPQWGIPVRYFVPVLPLMGVFIAHSVQRIDNLVYRGIFSGTLLLSISAGGLLMLDPTLPQAYTLQGRPGLLAKYDQVLSVDLERYVPSFRPEIVTIYTDGPWPGEVGSAALDIRALERPADRGGLGRWVIKAETESESEGYLFDRQWPGTEQAQLLSAGQYSACFTMRADQPLDAATVVATLEVSIAGSTLARQQIQGGDFVGEGYSVLCLTFAHPGAKPLRFRVGFTDEADLWLSSMSLSRVSDPRSEWLLAGFWVAMVVTFTACSVIRPLSRSQRPSVEAPARRSEVTATESRCVCGAMTAVLVCLIIAALGSYVCSLVSPRAFEAEGLRHLTGEVVTDAEASGGKAAYARRDMEKNALVYGPYEFFRPGEYEVLFSMKTGTASPGAEVAAIDVYGTASGVLVMQSLMSDDFEQPDRYQESRLLFSNPASQALQFRVHFLAAADLWVDKITVQRVGGYWSALDEPE